MTGACVECGDESAAGQFAARCAECIAADTPARERDRIVLDTHYQDGRGRRLIAERQADGDAWDVVEYRLTKGGGWKEVGEEGAADVSLRAE